MNVMYIIIFFERIEESEENHADNDTIETEQLQKWKKQSQKVKKQLQLLKKQF